MPPNAPPQVCCDCWNGALLPVEMNPPADRSIQLLKVLVPPSNICSGVNGVGAVVGGALVSAANRAQAGEVRPSKAAPHRQPLFLSISVMDFIGFRFTG